MKTNSNFFFALVMTVILTKGLAVSGNGLGVGWVALLFLACYPWTINGNVYSLFGGYSEKSIYSLIGVVQIAEQDATQIFGVSLIQLSENGVALQCCGISVMQIGNKCYQMLGLALFQYSDEESIQWFGVAGAQVSKEVSVQIGGISFFQSGGLEAGQAVGLTFYQKAEIVDHYCGLACYQTAKEFNTTFTSIHILQNAW